MSRSGVNDPLMWFWTWDDKNVYVPDVKFDRQTADMSLVPLRGHPWFLAVKKNGKYVGYINIESVGYKNVKDWMTDNQSAPGGFGCVCSSRKKGRR